MAIDGIYNVKDYGALGNGSTDDTAAIQAAIDATQVATVKGGTVVFPAGQYKITSQLSLVEYTGVRLLGMSTQVFSVRSPFLPISTLVFTTDGVGLPVNERGYPAFIDSRSNNGFEMKGIGVSQMSPSFTGNFVDCSHSSGGSDAAWLRFDRCAFFLSYFDGTEYPVSAHAAISFDNAIEFSVEKCSFFGTLSAIRGQEESGGIGYSNVGVVRDSQFSRTPKCIVNPGQSWIIEGNTAEGLGTATWHCINFVVDDLTHTEYSHDLLTIRNNWCGDAFGEQEWIKIRVGTTIKIESTLLEGGIGCIAFVAAPEVSGAIEISSNELSPSSGYTLDFDLGAGGASWREITIASNAFDVGPVLHCPKTAFVYGNTGANENGLADPSINGVRLFRAYSPDEIVVSTPIAAWWKADAIAGHADGDSVATWTDSSANSRDLVQATGGKQPLYKTNIQNSKPVVRFDGINDLLAAAAWYLPAPYSIYIVFAATSSGATGDTVLDGGTVDNARIYRAGVWSTSVGGVMLGLRANTCAVYCGELNAEGNGSGQVRGGDVAVQGDPAWNATSLGGVTVGSRADGTNPMAVDVCEIVVVSRILDPFERYGLIEYLRAKWAAV